MVVLLPSKLQLASCGLLTIHPPVQMMVGAGTQQARMQILALTAARVKADRKAAAEAANKQARVSALKAKKACEGNSKCEDVLNQVMGIFGQPGVGK